MKKIIPLFLIFFASSLFAQDLFTDASRACQKIALERTKKIVERSFDKQNGPRINQIVGSDMAVDTFETEKEWVTVRAKIITFIEDDDRQTLNAEYTFLGQYNRSSGECRLPKRPDFHDWWCDDGLLGLLSPVKCIK